MDGQAPHTSASALQRREREDRLGCRCQQEAEERPDGAGVKGAATASGRAVASICAAPLVQVADQLILDELHERLGS